MVNVGTVMLEDYIGNVHLGQKKDLFKVGGVFVYCVLL